MSALALLGKTSKSGGGISGVLVVLTVVVEEFASFVVFECPCFRILRRFLKKN